MSADSPSPEPYEKKLRRRPWLIAGGIAIMLLGALVYFYFADAEPPQDADLQPQLTEGGGPRNPLVIFLEEVSSFDRIQAYQLPYPEEGYKAEDTQLMEDVVAKNAFVFPAFKKLMATDRSLWRWPGDRGTSTPLPDNLSACERLTDVALWTRAELLLRKGERQQAARLAVSMHRFGHGLLRAEGSGVYYRQVLKIQETARLGLIHALEGETSPDFLREVQEALSGEEPQTSDLVQVIKRDYVLFKATSQALRHDEGFVEFFGRPPDNQMLWYRPNHTLWLDVNFRRVLLAGLESGWGKAQAQADAALETVAAREKKRWALLPPPNAFGLSLWWQLKPDDLVRDTAAQVSNHRMLIISIAIRRYALSRNSLPNTLQDLVPEYLPAVPVDPLDNAPIQWNPVKRALLARGLRLPGAPGAAIGRSDDGDILFPLWWKSP